MRRGEHTPYRGSCFGCGRVQVCHRCFASPSFFPSYFPSSFLSFSFSFPFFPFLRFSVASFFLSFFLILFISFFLDFFLSYFFFFFLSSFFFLCSSFLSICIYVLVRSVFSFSPHATYCMIHNRCCIARRCAPRLVSLRRGMGQKLRPCGTC